MVEFHQEVSAINRATPSSFSTHQFILSMATLVTAMVCMPSQLKVPGRDLEEATGKDYIRERLSVYCCVLMASGVLSFLLAIYQVLLHPEIEGAAPAEAEGGAGPTAPNDERTCAAGQGDRGTCREANDEEGADTADPEKREADAATSDGRGSGSAELNGRGAGTESQEGRGADAASPEELV